MPERILLIPAGGTINAAAYENPKSPPEYVTVSDGKAGILLQTLSKLPRFENIDILAFDRSAKNPFAKDSQLFTAKDLKNLAGMIQQHDNRYVILTHGTDAMIENARILQHYLEDSAKTVIFVGAIVPLSMQHNHPSDGVTALRFALDHILHCPAGVYIVGCDSITAQWGIFDLDNIQKDRETSLDKLTFSVKPR